MRAKLWARREDIDVAQVAALFGLLAGDAVVAHAVPQAEGAVVIDHPFAGGVIAVAVLSGGRQGEEKGEGEGQAHGVGFRLVWPLVGQFRDPESSRLREARGGGFPPVGCGRA